MSLLSNILQYIGSHIVVEYGNSRIWTYKKYADGSCEAWGEWSSTQILAWTQMGSSGLYYTSISTLSYPFTIYDNVPTVTCKFASANIGWAARTIGDNTSVSFYLVKFGSGGTGGQTAYIHVKGRWK